MLAHRPTPTPAGRPCCRRTRPCNRVGRDAALPPTRASRTPSDADAPRPIFSTFPPTGEATLYDARDAMETCDTLTGEGLRSCYAQFGVDAARVRQWYGPVASLEALWEVSGRDGRAAAAPAAAPAPPPPSQPLPGRAVGASTSPVATLDEDEYSDGKRGNGGGGGGGGGGGSPAPWWPPLPPLWT